MRNMEERKAVDLRYHEANTKGEREEVEELLEGGREKEGVIMLLDEMLRFLAEMPVDRHHDYKILRHGGLGII